MPPIRALLSLSLKLELSNVNEKTRENRPRRKARRQGLVLQKSRARDPRNPTYGTYCLVNEYTNTLEYGDYSNGYGLDLDGVEAALNE